MGGCRTVVTDVAIGGGGGGIAVNCVVSRRLVGCCDGIGLVSCVENCLARSLCERRGWEGGSGGVGGGCGVCRRVGVRVGRGVETVVTLGVCCGTLVAALSS